MTRTKVTPTTLTNIQEKKAELEKQLAALAIEEKKFESEYVEYIKDNSEKSIREICSENKGNEFYNDYFMPLTLAQIVEILKPGKKAKKAATGTRGTRIPKNVQQYYTLLAVEEGAIRAKDIKGKYGDFIKSPMWITLAKDGLLEQHGEKPLTSYTISGTGNALLDELKEDKSVTEYTL